jgi:YDG domain-containing protein/Big-like domain-containing protein
VAILTDSYTSAAFTDKNVGTGKTVNVSGISISGTDSGNYTLNGVTTVTTTANITQRTLNVSATGMNKVYDGTTSATVTLSDDRVSGDMLTDSYTSATFTDRNVGTGKTVNVSGISITGPDSGNYTLNGVTTETTTANITTRPITVTAASDTKTYDGTTTSTGAPTITMGSLATGDTMTSFTQVFDSRNAGSRTLIPSGTVNDGNGGNSYAYTFATTNGTINKRPITVTAATDTKIYDGTTASTGAPTITTGSLATGDTTTNFTQVFDSRNAGSRTLIPSGTVNDGNGGNNYAYTFATANGTINKRAITVTAATDTKIYDGTTTSTGAPTITTGSLATGDTTTNFTQVFDSKNAGSRMLIPGGTVNDGNGGSNYAYTFANANGTINPAATSTTVSSSVNPSVFQQSVTFTATVKNTQTSPIPTGSVQFVIDGVNFGSPVGLVAGVASISSGTLAVNTHTVQANFVNADGNFSNGNGSLSGGQVVNKASTTTSVISSANPSVLNQSVTFTATVTVVAPGSGSPTAPTGSVTFADTTTSTTIGTVPLGAGGTAAISTSSLPVNANNIKATYSGDGNFTGSNNSLVQTVQYASGGMCDGDAGHLILQPINADGTSVFNGKSTSPAKFRVCDANGVSIGTPGVVTAFNIIKIVGGTVANVDEDVVSTTPDTVFRWDPTAQQWIFNINNKSLQSNQTYFFRITLNDGTTILFNYGLK